MSVTLAWAPHIHYMCSLRHVRLRLLTKRKEEPMSTIRTRLAPIILMGMLTLPAALTAQTEERSQTQGLKETEKFVKAGESHRSGG